MGNEWLYRYLRYRAPQLQKIGTGATFKELSKRAVSNLEVILPPMNYQLAAVRELSEVERVMATVDKQLNLLDSLVKSRFVEMFVNKKFPEYQLGARLRTSAGGTPSKQHHEYYDNGTIPWLTSGEVNKGHIAEPEHFITTEGLRKSSAKLVPPNTVVVAMYGATAGQVGIVDYETATNQAVCCIPPSPGVVPTFLRYALESRKRWMIEQCAGGAQPNISQGIIKRVLLPDVPLALQREFADFASRVDKLRVDNEPMLKVSTHKLASKRNQRSGLTI